MSDSREEGSESVRQILQIVAGGILLVVAGVLDKLEFPTYVTLAGYLISYLILGYEVVADAVKNVFKGKLIDENFLMTVATVAAFIIGEYAEAVGVMLFFDVGEFFEDLAVRKSRESITHTADMRPETVLLVKAADRAGHFPDTDEGDVTVIPAGDARIGDILLVRAGDRIPLDGVIVSGKSSMDTAPITGEPFPVDIAPGSEVLSGCVNLTGSVKLKVRKKLSDSMVSRILRSVTQAEEGKPRIDRFITRFSKIYTPIVVALAAVIAVIPSFVTGDWHRWVYTAVNLLVISCPCALVISVPLAFFATIGAASKRGILFKDGIALETLSRVKAVVMDKTGTLTEGRFKVTDTVCLSERYTREDVLSFAAACEAESTHPIASGIIKAAKSENVRRKKAESVREIAGKGVRAVIDGGEVLCGSLGLLKLYHADTDAVEDAEKSSVKPGKTAVYVSCEGHPAGIIYIGDAVKKDAAGAVSELKKSGLRTVMLTGDEKEPATEAARKIGIEEVYAKLLPEDKLEILKKVRAKYGPSMFVGDGINDSPVLAGADVGAAMGSGADAAICAADVVFMNPSVQSVPLSIAFSKKATRVAAQNVVFALLAKAVIMILTLFGKTILWLSVFADTGVALLCVLNSVRLLAGKIAGRAGQTGKR